MRELHCEPSGNGFSHARPREMIFGDGTDPEINSIDIDVSLLKRSGHSLVLRDLRERLVRFQSQSDAPIVKRWQPMISPALQDGSPIGHRQIRGPGKRHFDVGFKRVLAFDFREFDIGAGGKGLQ